MEEKEKETASDQSSGDTLPSFGDWLRQRRRTLDWTQAELANRVGCARITIRKMEANELRPSKALAGALAEQLGIPPAGSEAFIRYARSGRTDIPPPSPAPGWSAPAHHSPLPLALEELYGREQETETLRELFASSARLVTLTGPGGVGKTSLAMQAAAGLGSLFEDGIAWVDLTTLRDARLVPATLADALGLQERSGPPVEEMLKEFLQTRRILLVVDNFEQVVSASALVADLLSACPRVAFMVTSREPLRIRGEKEFRVDLLGPDSARALFVARARSVKPDFALTDENASAVAEICARLDGLPLAIELVAGHMRALTPQELLARIDTRLPAGARRDVPLRHRTLDDTMRWSYDLLDARAQELFRQVAVFAGGWTLQAAETVAGGPILESLTRLIEKSLVIADARAGATRYRLLGTLREFAQAQLVESGEAERARARHAQFYLELAEAAEPHLTRAEQLTWFDRLDAERVNLRAALDWAETGHAELALRLSGVLAVYWDYRSYFSEGREHLAAALTMPGAEEGTLARAKALYGTGMLAFEQGDFAIAREVLQESQFIYAERDPESIASADTLRMLGYTAAETGDYGTALALIDQALRMARALGDTAASVRAARDMGWLKLRTGDDTAAARFLQDALEQVSAVGDRYERLFSLSGLAEVKLRQGDLTRARELEEEVLEQSRALGDLWRIAASLGNLARIALRRQEIDQAIEPLSESLTLRQEFGDRAGCAWCLEQFAEIALLQAQTWSGAPAQIREQFRRAARLYGAAAARRATVGSRMDLVDQAAYERHLAVLRAALDAAPAAEKDAGFEAAWAEGQGMPTQEAIDYALAASVSSPKVITAPTRAGASDDYSDPRSNR